MLSSIVIFKCSSEVQCIWQAMKRITTMMILKEMSRFFLAPVLLSLLLMTALPPVSSHQKFSNGKLSGLILGPDVSVKVA